MSTAPVPPPVQPGPRKRRLTTTDKLLGGILATLVALVAAVLVLAGTVYVVTRPVPAPTGPTVTVEAFGTVINGRATYSLSDATGTTTISLSEPGMSADKQSWLRQVAFGGTIELTVMLAEVYTDDETGEPGSATCMLTINDTAVSSGAIDVANGVGSCRWTNNGK